MSSPHRDLQHRYPKQQQQRNLKQHDYQQHDHHHHDQQQQDEQQHQQDEQTRLQRQPAPKSELQVLAYYLLKPKQYIFFPH